MRLLLIMIAILLATLTLSLAAEQTTVFTQHIKPPAGCETRSPLVDWANGRIFVTVTTQPLIITSGTMANLAARAIAVTAAKAQARDALRTLKLTSFATLAVSMRTHLIPDDVITPLLANLELVNERWDPATHNISVTCVLPLLGQGAASDFAARILATEQDATATRAPVPVPTDTMLLYSPAPAKQIADAPYTGVIFDCTDIALTPVMLPKLVGLDGAEIWGTRGVNTLEVMDHGLVGYASTLRAARESGRAGDSPLLLRPLGVSGVYHGDLVLSTDDAKLLRQQDEVTHFLKKLPVVFVLGPEKTMTTMKLYDTPRVK